MTGAKLLLVHVADGWVARNFDQLKLAESEEMQQDRAYLEKRRSELSGEGFSCDAVLAMGEPSDEIIKLARAKNVDLIAMTTHGHRLVSDILYGATADKVRHAVEVSLAQNTAFKRRNVCSGSGNACVGSKCYPRKFNA